MSATRRDLLPAPWEHGRDHPCDERCVCPVHGTPMFYSAAGNDHACQDVNCRYGHGMKDAGPVRPGEDPVVLSPGQVPPEVARRYPSDFIERINQPRQRPGEEPTP